VDFDDLLSLAVQLLQTQPDVLTWYRKKFKHILVDEFQVGHMMACCCPCRVCSLLAATA
jgi:hypothetical protein